MSLDPETVDMGRPALPAQQLLKIGVDHQFRPAEIGIAELFAALAIAPTLGNLIELIGDAVRRKPRAQPEGRADHRRQTS